MASRSGFLRVWMPEKAKWVQRFACIEKVSGGVLTLNLYKTPEKKQRSRSIEFGEIVWAKDSQQHCMPNQFGFEVMLIKPPNLILCVDTKGDRATWVSSINAGKSQQADEMPSPRTRAPGGLPGLKTTNSTRNLDFSSVHQVSVTSSGGKSARGKPEGESREGRLKDITKKVTDKVKTGEPIGKLFVQVSEAHFSTTADPSFRPMVYAYFEKQIADSEVSRSSANPKWKDNFLFSVTSMMSTLKITIFNGSKSKENEIAHAKLTIDHLEDEKQRTESHELRGNQLGTFSLTWRFERKKTDKDLAAATQTDDREVIGTFQFAVVSASGLRPRPGGGPRNAVGTLMYSGQTFQTPPAFSLNPEWNFSVVFRVRDLTSVLTIRLIDQDTVKRTHLGSVSIASTILSHSRDSPEPLEQTMKLQMEPEDNPHDNSVGGELIVRFRYTDAPKYRMIKKNAPVEIKANLSSVPSEFPPAPPAEWSQVKPLGSYPSPDHYKIAKRKAALKAFWEDQLGLYQLKIQKGDDAGREAVLKFVITEFAKPENVELFVDVDYDRSYENTYSQPSGSFAGAAPSRPGTDSAGRPQNPRGGMQLDPRQIQTGSFGQDPPSRPGSNPAGMASSTGGNSSFGGSGGGAFGSSSFGGADPPSSFGNSGRPDPGSFGGPSQASSISNSSQRSGGMLGAGAPAKPGMAGGSFAGSAGPQNSGGGGQSSFGGSGGGQSSFGGGGQSSFGVGGQSSFGGGNNSGSSFTGSGRPQSMVFTQTGRPQSMMFGNQGWGGVGHQGGGFGGKPQDEDEDPFAVKQDSLFGPAEPVTYNAMTTKGPFSLESAIPDTDTVFHDLLFKIVIIGCSGVGKTGLLGRWMTNKFDSTSATISVEFKTKTFQVEGKYVKIQMWDTAGQEQFRALTQGFYRNASGAVLVYDVTNVDSFRKLDSWLKPVQEAQGNEDVQIMVVGNKIDLDFKRKISTEEGLEWAKQNRCSFLETSAMDGSNVHRAFQILLQDIFALTKRLNSELPPTPTKGGKSTPAQPQPVLPPQNLGVGGGIQIVSNPNAPPAQDFGACCMDVLLGKEDSDSD